MRRAWYWNKDKCLFMYFFIYLSVSILVKWGRAWCWNKDKCLFMYFFIYLSVSIAVKWGRAWYRKKDKYLCIYLFVSVYRSIMRKSLILKQGQMFIYVFFIYFSVSIVVKWGRAWYWNKDKCLFMYFFYLFVRVYRSKMRKSLILKKGQIFIYLFICPCLS